MLKRYIGDRSFYNRVMAIAIPIILQNLLTNFVSMLDNVMVGQLSTAQISAVTIANNNLLFIFNLCLFGGAAGAGIFTTQFYGSGDLEGIRHTFRFKLLICLGLSALGAGIFLTSSDSLVNLYLQGEGDSALAAETLYYGKQYLFIMMIGMLPFAISNTYASTLRECGHASVPMFASLAATGVNLSLNYVLIFGHFGFPSMGVAGAAIATVIARYAECAILIIWTHINPQKNPYIRGIYKTFYIPKHLLKTVTLKGMPLLLNECVWSLGIAILNQCYSVCHLDVVPALSISSTIYNLTAVVFRSFGNTSGILVGQLLGAGTPKKEIRDYTRKLFTLCIASGVAFGLLTLGLSGIFPKIYNTTPSVQQLATWLITISASTMAFQAYIFPVYFIMRAGGKTMSTFFFDCGVMWVVSIPIAYILSRQPVPSIIFIFILTNLVDVFKCVIGYFMIQRDSWMQNLTH